MRTLAGIVLAGLALGSAAWWLARTPSRAPGSSPQRAMEDRPGEPARAVTPLAPSNDETSSREPVPSSTREAVESATTEDTSVRWIEGRVVFPPGTPADERAFVVDRSKGIAERSTHRAPVAADGSFRLLFPAKERGGRLRLEARFLYAEQVPWRRDAGEPILIQAKLGARIEVRLRPPEGIEPASVGGALQLLTSRSGVTFGLLEERPVTGDTSIAFEALWPGRTGYSVLYFGERFLGRLDGFELVAGKTLVAELVLRPGITLAGIVRDEDGAPLNGVRLAASSRLPSATDRLHRSTWATSAADGTFQVGAIAGGRVELVAEHAGFLSATRDLGELVEGTSIEELEIVLDDGLTIAGSVRWPDGTPATAELTLESIEPLEAFAPVELEAESEADGTFAFAGLTAGEYRLKAWATRTELLPVISSATRIARAMPQYVGWAAEIERVPAGARDLVVTLSGGLALEGLVVDELGRPLGDFTVEARALGAERRRAELTRSFEDAAGAFRLEGFAPGDWILSAHARGHARTQVHLALPASQPARLVVPREAVVRGIVLDPFAAPVPRARIVVRQPDGRFPLSERELSADPQGRFEIQGLGPAPTTLQAHGQRFAPSEPVTLELLARERVDGLRLELREGGWAQIRVYQDGEPVDAVLTALDEHGARQHTLELRIGEHRIGPALAGAYTVRARRDGKTVERHFEVVPGAPELTLELTFE